MIKNVKFLILCIYHVKDTVSIAAFIFINYIIILIIEYLGYLYKLRYSLLLKSIYQELIKS